MTSVVGRQDYARVLVRWSGDQVGEGQAEVEPIAIAGASVLSSTSRADGFAVIPADSEGYPPGAEVEFFLYDPN
jgi:molybdopterin molybdotransferase